MIASFLCLENIRYAELPTVATALTREGISGLGERLTPRDISRLSTDNIVVGCHLQMLQRRDTQTNIDTEVGLLQRVTATLLPIEITISNIDTPLRTGKEETINEISKADAITKINRNGYLLLLHGLFLLRVIRQTALTIVIEGGGVNAQARERQTDFHHRANKPAGTIGSIKDFLTQMHIRRIDSGLDTKLDLGISRRGKDEGCQGSEKDSLFHNAYDFLINNSFNDAHDVPSHEPHRREQHRKKRY